MIIPPNINETKRNKILIPTNGLQFSTFLINVLFLGNFLHLKMFLEIISSVSIAHSSILIDLTNFLLSHLQLLAFHEYPFLHFFTIKHSHLHLFFFNSCILLQTFFI